VTLFREGELRGCIGHIFPREPLYRAVIECAHGAAMRDPRFPAVTGFESDKLTIEISVLTAPQLIQVILGTGWRMCGQGYTV
jgi:AMMECR1 domain-containing protein